MGEKERPAAADSDASGAKLLTRIAFNATLSSDMKLATLRVHPGTLRSLKRYCRPRNLKTHATADSLLQSELKRQFKLADDHAKGLNR